MKPRIRSRSATSIGSNQASPANRAASAGRLMLSSSMAWSPPACHRRSWLGERAGDYAAPRFQPLPRRDLRGVNLPLLDDWDFPQKKGASIYFQEIEKTKANAVRIQWYKDYDKANGTNGRPAYQGELFNVLHACTQNHMIPILMLMDLTSKDGDKDVLEE